MRPALANNLKEDSTDPFERLERCHRLLTVKELAVMLAISEKTLYSYVSRLMIPYLKIESSIRFRPKDIAAWLRRRVFCVS
jgi:excisionase family DNA binding protein